MKRSQSNDFCCNECIPTLRTLQVKCDVLTTRLATVEAENEKLQKECTEWKYKYENSTTAQGLR